MGLPLDEFWVGDLFNIELSMSKLNPEVVEAIRLLSRFDSS